MPPTKNTKRTPKRPWQEVAIEAQEYRDGTVMKVEPPLAGVPLDLPLNVMSIPRDILTTEEIRITETAPEELVNLLSSGSLTATVTIRAFLRRAALAQKLTNCVTELLPERALKRAQYLDEYFKQYGKPIGPLHGLPISVKEHIGMKDLGLNAAFVAFWGKKATDDAHILKILWRAGAVFHARTTQPQTLMHLETDSNLLGVTVNPYNSNMSSGGSSGGEGALIGLRGSVLGIGTDIGGSIRSPAAGNGIYGLKPTSFRIPTDGWSSTMAGADPIATCIGPMSTSIAGLKMFMRTILDAKPWLSEPALMPMPWTYDINTVSSRPLKIAVLWHDGVVRPHPPITRALNEMVSALRKVPNVTVVDWKPHQHDEAWAIISSLYYTDGGDEDIALLEESGEPMRPLTHWIIKENPCVKKLTMGEFYYWCEEREAYRKEYANAWTGTATGVDWETGEPIGMVDAILCPVGPGVAPKHNTAKYWGYTSQWNLLDYPGVVFPVTKVDPQLDVVGGKFRSLTHIDQENWNLYNPESFADLPVSLQLVGRRFEDEKIVAILEYIQSLIGLPFTPFP